MSDVRVEFVNFPRPKTGATTDRALFRVYDDGEHVASVVSGISLTLLATAGLSEQRPDEIRDAIRANAPAQIRRHYDDGTLSGQDTVDTETYIVDLTSYNTDSDQLRASG